MRPPTGEMVAVLWGRGLDLPTDCQVDTQVATAWAQEQDPGWPGREFVVAAVVGGAVDPYDPQRSPVVQWQCWARSPNKGGAYPFGRANDLAELVREAAYAMAAYIPITTPAGYLDAQITDLSIESEPRRVLTQIPGLARYVLDISMTFVI